MTPASLHNLIYKGVTLLFIWEMKNMEVWNPKVPPSHVLMLLAITGNDGPASPLLHFSSNIHQGKYWLYSTEGIALSKQC